MDSVTLAERSAPHVDRLVFSVHRAAREGYRESVDGLAARVGRDSLFFASSVAGPLLGGGLTRLATRHRYRYAPEAELVARIEAMFKEDSLRIDGDRLVPSPALAEAAAELVALRHRAAVDLWRGSDVASASEPIARILSQPPLVEDGLMASQMGWGEPDEPEPRLLHRLLLMRYLRNDAHAAAWAEAGLSAAEMVQLTPRWLGEEPSRDDDAAVAALTERGLVDGDRLTVAGRDLRDQVEARTNENAAPAYNVLADEERAAWLSALEALPGDG